MTAAELAEEFHLVRLGKHKRIELQEKISGSNRYFSKLITLPNSGEVVRISNQWGTENQWSIFKNHMEKRGYSIMQYRIVNINDGEQRHWEHCSRFSFVCAGGRPRYCSEVDKLKQGDLLFVCRVGDKISSTERGCVGYCRVISEKAIDVENIQTSKGNLGDIKLDDGKTYRQKFCNGKKFPDKAVSVEWIKLRDNSPVKMTGTHRGFCTNPFSNEDFNNLAKEFDIKITESE